MGRRKKKVAAKGLTYCEPIPCSLKTISEYGTTLPNWNPNERRFGRYSGCSYSGITTKQYAVLVRIEGDFAVYLKQGLSDHEIIESCIAFLNIPPLRKKYAKTTPKALYGTLQLIKWQRKLDEDERVYYVVAMATTRKKSKYFWGVGREK